MGDTLKSLLAEIGRHNINAIGVLADYLEENKLPHAKRVRRWWQWYTNRVEWWTNGKRDHSRRRLTVWENMEIDKEYVRIKIGQIYQRQWVPSSKWAQYF